MFSDMKVSMGWLWDFDINKDYTIIKGSESYRCHKAILAAGG